MKTTTISWTTKRVAYRTVKLKVGKFIVTDSYVDGELNKQSWSNPKGFKTTHKKAYEPSKLRFHYYEDISFLDSENLGHSDEFYKEIPAPTLITDWSEFKGFDHVICIWLSMDGNLYRIDRATPLLVWRYQDNIGGFTGEHYFLLPELKKEIEALDFTRNVHIMDIPHYNGGGKAVEFEYKHTTSMVNHDLQITHPAVKKIAKKYRKKEREDY